MDRSVYGEGDTSNEPYGLAYQPFRLTKKDTPAPGCKFPILVARIQVTAKFCFFANLTHLGQHVSVFFS